ncbi:gamma-glutamyltransferase [Limobrevibacterium gyesilva]|uniref:Gamma-glutamyltransferase n=1 Tax=Limobrevibacterium gyesilva TaxID=2991712 RepID=A0AA41YKE6_9PROT|nr:gamma-glutamyltransferase [Limobrevibacterium gyesilva]MCW3474225.1 gamma-glutamyltransferase [Limobrevibacterium gyesilva]
MTDTPPPHTTQHWHVTKPSASGKRGIVVAQARGAAEAGIAVLEAGGNAIDAAVATALALATVEPWNSGLGGIGFALVHRAGQKNAEVVDFGPMAPHRLSPANFKLTGRMTTDLFAWPEVEGDANIHGPLSFAIPSSVAGYHKLHATWGRLPLADVIAPAVALAKRGLPQDWFTTLKIALSAGALRLYPESARIYLPNGLPPVPPYQGSPGFFRQGNLPATLERLQHAGLRDFYEGDVAAAIAADAVTVGSVLDADDLRNCQARILPATEVPWRNGRTLQLATGLTAAPTLTRVLAQMRDAPWDAAPDAPWYRALARIMKAAYVERLTSLGETEPLAAASCTTHLTVCDQDGTMVAVTTTLMSSMGSRVVLPQSGVLMNNGIMWFDPRPDTPNSIAPGKRPLTNMCPIIMKHNDQPILAAGASGGRRIMAAVFQLMSYVSDFGMDPETAAHYPRIDVSGTEGVTADRRLAADILSGLQQDGPTEMVEHGVVPVNFACPNIIVQHPDGTRTGVSDAQSPWSAALAQ